MTNEPRRLPALRAGHPEIGKRCAACGNPYVEGDVLTLVVVGPGASSDARKKAREGRPYTAVGVSAHYACVTGIEE